MNIREGISPEYLNAYQKGWLNLTLGENLVDSSPLRPMKAYTCNFCKRKFNSPQALGGHQNAHKRERQAAMNHMVKLSLGVQAHTPSRDDETTIARFVDGGARYEATLVQPCVGEETVDLKWPEGFYSEAHAPSQPSSPHRLDLNLKL